MAFTHLKAISSKVNAKLRAQLQTMKRKVLKTKAGDANNAVTNNAALGINEAAKINQATADYKADTVNTTISDVDILQSTDVRLRPHWTVRLRDVYGLRAKPPPTDVTSADGESTNTKTPTTAKSQTPIISSASEKVASQASLIQPNIGTLPQRGKAKRQHTKRMLKRRAPIADNIDAGRPRKKVRRNKQGPLVEQTQANEEVEDADAHVASPSSQKSENKARRAARRQARKAKWAVRCTAFKTIAKKVLDAAVTPSMVALVTIFSPVIMALGIVGIVIHSVIMLIIHLLDCLCAPVMLCIWWPLD